MPIIEWSINQEARIRMRHNELFKNSENQFYIQANTRAGRYSMWTDNSQISLADLRIQKNLKLLLKDVRFIVPLKKQDLYLIRSAAGEIVSDQFVFIEQTLADSLPKRTFSSWFLDVGKEYLRRTTITWVIWTLTMCSFYAYLRGWNVYPHWVPWIVKTSLFCTTVIPIVVYNVWSSKTNYYSLTKIFKTELWIYFITTSIFVFGLFRIAIGHYTLW